LQTGAKGGRKNRLAVFDLELLASRGPFEGDHDSARSGLFGGGTLHGEITSSSLAPRQKMRMGAFGYGKTGAIPPRWGLDSSMP